MTEPHVKLMTLEAWAQHVYGEAAPKRTTLRAWARNAKIFPAPEKHGRAYFVREDARYLRYNDPRRRHPSLHPNRLIRRIGG